MRKDIINIGVLSDFNLKLYFRELTNSINELGIEVSFEQFGYSTMDLKSADIEKFDYFIFYPDFSSLISSIPKLSQVENEKFIFDYFNHHGISRLNGKKILTLADHSGFVDWELYGSGLEYYNFIKLFHDGFTSINNEGDVQLSFIGSKMSSKSFERSLRDWSWAKSPFSGDIDAALWPISIGLKKMIHGNLKVIFVDFDYTLWEGAVGDIGVENIKLEEGHNRLQLLLKNFSNRGISLIGLTKNDKDVVENMFDERTDFPLSSSDFAFISADWSPKSSRIKNILSKLKLLPKNSLVIDDNHVELNEIFNASSELAIINSLPSVLASNKLQAFSDISTVITEEDSSRSSFYRQLLEMPDTNSHEAVSEFHSDFFGNLEVFHVDDSSIERSTQLIEKTNQFKMNTNLISGNFKTKLDDSSYHWFSGRYKDKFGEYGIIVSGLFHKNKKDNLIEISQLVLSCRAFSRGVAKKFIEDCILDLASKDFSLSFNFDDTGRNHLVKDFIEEWDI